MIKNQNIGYKTTISNDNGRTTTEIGPQHFVSHRKFYNHHWHCQSAALTCNVTREKKSIKIVIHDEHNLVISENGISSPKRRFSKASAFRVRLTAPKAKNR